MADLRPSKSIVIFKTGISVLVGGLITLLYCGQFGVAGTEYAHRFNHHLHMQNELFCAAVCGALFTIAPLIVLRAITNYHQFRVIINNKLYVPLLWIGAFGALLAYHGNLSGGIGYFFVWMAAAVAVFLFGAKLIKDFYKMSRKGNLI